MLKQSILLAMIMCLAGTPGFAQGAFEMGATRGLSVGAGAGTAAAIAGNRNRGGQPAAAASPVAGNKQPAAANTVSKDDTERNRVSGQEFQKAGRMAEAEKCYRAALLSLSKTKGADSEEGQKLIENLSSVCCSQKKYAEAAGFYSTILTVTVKQYGADDSRTIAAKHHLADILTEKGDQVAAIKHLDEAIASAKRLQTPLDQSKMIEMLDSYAIALRGLDREAEANQIERRATELYAAREKGQ